MARALAGCAFRTQPSPAARGARPARPGRPVLRVARAREAAVSLTARSDRRHDLAHELVQRGQTEGLLEKRYASLGEETLVFGMRAGAGDDDHAPQQMGVPPLQLPVKADSVELGHAEIAEDAVIFLGLDLLEGQPAIVGDVDLVPFVGQDAGYHLRDGGIVFDHEDAEGLAVNLCHKVFPSKWRTRF